MIIIGKKRIIILSLLAVILIFTCSIVTNKVENTVETVALPVTNKVIVLDARTSAFQMSGAQSSTRNNRSPNKLKNSFKSTKLIRAIWSNSSTNQK